MTKATLGRAGEQLAAYWLGCLGYCIRDKNVTYRRGELDLVCQDGQELVFVEVRLRSDRSLQTPAESVSPAKQRRVYLAAAAYLSKAKRWQHHFRFDLVEITLTATHVRAELLPNYLTVKGGW